MKTLEDFSDLNNTYLFEIKGGGKVNWGKVETCAAGIAVGASEG